MAFGVWRDRLQPIGEWHSASWHVVFGVLAYGMRRAGLIALSVLACGIRRIGMITFGLLACSNRRVA